MTASHSDSNDVRSSDDVIAFEFEGGSYSKMVLSRDDVKALSKELWHADGGCLRCGRKNHWAGACAERTDVAGNAIVAGGGSSGARRVGGTGGDGLARPPHRQSRSSRVMICTVADVNRSHSGGARRQRGNGKGVLTCYRCGQSGHFANRCRSSRPGF